MCGALLARSGGVSIKYLILNLVALAISVTSRMLVGQQVNQLKARFVISVEANICRRSLPLTLLKFFVRLAKQLITGFSRLNRIKPVVKRVKESQFC